ncbi:MAG: hypothetical protein OEX22_12590 [Cyclobacteriaceae bacterium]|nr:hypothetical protein [Cyclobacteriaceae bacterium]
MRNSFIIISLGFVMLFSCTAKPSQKTEKKQIEEEVNKTLRLEKLWETDTLLTTAESVIYNSNADILYVSNINGTPLQKDGNGFISQVDMDGNIIVEKWVTNLDAPKGMGIFNGKLYVTNITQLVEIDINDTEITNRWEVEGAVFLNDITIDKEGTVYFSDSNTNKIHVLKQGNVSEYMASDRLASPNGLYIEQDRLMLATMGSSSFGYIELSTKEFIIKTDSIGAGDGVAPMGDGGYLVSNWNGEVFHVNGETWNKTSLLRTVEDAIQSADITYVIDKQMLLVPTFFNNTIIAYRLIEE